MITVVIPTYNRQSTIGRAVDSVLGQSYIGPVEVVVVDDGSTDDTLQYLEAKYQNKVNILKTGGRKGAPFARNLGLLQASFDYVAFQDSDDIWFTDKLDKQLNFMVMHDLDFSFTSFIHARGSRVKKIPAFYPSSTQGVIENGVGINHALLDNPCSTQTIMVKKSSLNMKFDEKLKRFQDWDFFLDALKNDKKCGHLDEVLAYVSLGDDSLSKNRSAGVSSRSLFIKKYLDHPSVKMTTKLIFKIKLFVRVLASRIF